MNATDHLKDTKCIINQSTVLEGAKQTVATLLLTPRAISEVIFGGQSDKNKQNSSPPTRGGLWWP